jgi:transcriptional regulator with XRE-family HTH domain
MSNAEFGKKLSSLRQKEGLTVRALAEDAKVPHSLIAGLQTGSRRVGEYQARKIGVALNLKDGALDSFILAAINTCTEKVLEESKGYPASFLNMITRQLRLAGILPKDLSKFQITRGGTEHILKLYLQDGKCAQLSSILTIA